LTILIDSDNSMLDAIYNFKPVKHPLKLWKNNIKFILFYLIML